jgi:glutamine amidotransferase
MQLALDHSDEDGGVDGIGLLRGSVHLITEGRVPRLGWASVEPWGDAYYFAHSYAATCPHSVATSEGVTVAVESGAFLGVQFHPEKSGSAGLAFLERCLSPV